MVHIHTLRVQPSSIIGTCPLHTLRALQKMQIKRKQRARELPACQPAKKQSPILDYHTCQQEKRTS